MDNYTAIVILSCLTMCVLSILVFENARFDRNTKARFFLTYAVIILVTLAEWGGRALNEAPEWTMGNHQIVKCIDYVFTPVAGVCFALQISDEKERKRHIWMFAVLALNAVFEIISAFTGWTFYINSDNVYYHGRLYFVYVIVYCIAITDVLFSFLVYSKNFKKKNKVSLIAIIILVCTGIGFQEFGDGSIRTSCLSLALGSVLLFIHYNEFLQQRNDDNMSHQQVLIETDALTGILSRYSYIKELNEYDQKEALLDGLVVFSIDTNGLKSVNDNMGHIAGDKLICDAAECITEVLGQYGKCFRTGGDEFVAVLSIEKEKAAEIQRMLDTAAKKRKDKNGNSLSLSSGYAIAEEYPKLPLEELVNTADKMMYMHKEVYYAKSGSNGHSARASDKPETAEKISEYEE